VSVRKACHCHLQASSAAGVPRKSTAAWRDRYLHARITNRVKVQVRRPMHGVKDQPEAWCHSQTSRWPSSAKATMRNNSIRWLGLECIEVVFITSEGDVDAGVLGTG